jgi:hypothetical protein
MKRLFILAFVAFSLETCLACMAYAAGNYRNFKVSVYSRVYEVNRMADLDWLQSRWDEMSRQVKIDKIYLETRRDMVVAEKETLEKAKRFFEDRNVEVAGGGFFGFGMNTEKRLTYPVRIKPHSYRVFSGVKSSDSP